MKFPVEIANRSILLILCAVSLECRTTRPNNLRSELSGSDDKATSAESIPTARPTESATPLAQAKPTPTPTISPDVSAPVPGSDGLISITDNTTRGITLVWSPARDDRSPQAKLAYASYWSSSDNLGTAVLTKSNGTLIVAGLDDNPSKTTWKIGGLVGGITYWLNVVVIDEAGNSSAYKSISVTTPPASSAPDILAHGKQCSNRLGKLPAFSCLDGTELPIDVQGKRLRADMTPDERALYNFSGTTQQNCDHPALLSLSDQGRCVPFSRVGRLSSFGPDGKVLADVDAVFTCRRYRARLAGEAWQGTMYDGKSFPAFEDIAVIQHSRVTGETCFFQMLKAGYAPMDGRRVPPPDEATLPTGSPAYAIKSQDFWMTPTDTAAKNCNRCHDADPWIHSPYIDQAKNASGELIVPRGDFGGGRSGRYSVLGAPFAAWQPVVAVSSTDTTDTKGNSCTSCHDIGSLGGCTKWAAMSTGRMTMPNGTTTEAQSFANRYWMPPHASAGATAINDLATWKSEGWEKATQHLLDCCAAADGTPGCKRRTVTSVPPLFPEK